MFRRAESEKDYKNEGIKYRIVTTYEQAYRYNSPDGYNVPKLEKFIDINEKNYKEQNRERKIQMINLGNNREEYKNLEGEEKSIWSKIGHFILVIIEIIT